MRRGLGWSALLCGTCLGAPAFGQAINDTPPPQRQNLDANFVDRATGNAYLPHPVLAVGPAGRRGLSVTSFSSVNGNNADNGGSFGGAGTNWGLVIYVSGSTYMVGLGQTTESFTLSNGIFTPVTPTGSTLVRNGSGPAYTYTYTAANGTVIAYTNTMTSTQESQSSNIRAARARTITYPTGEVISLTWISQLFCLVQGDTCPTNQQRTRLRLQSVASSLGYQLHYNYNPNGDTGGDQYGTAQEAPLWNTLVSISAINTSLDYCDPTATSCTVANQADRRMLFSSSWASPVLTTQITDPEGRVSKYVSNYQTHVISVWTPGHPTSGNANMVYSSDSNGVTQVVRDGMTYGYAQSVSGTIRTVTMTDPLNHVSSTTADTANYQLLTSVDANGNTTTNHWDPTTHLLTSTDLPDEAGASTHVSIEYTYDARGNITKTLRRAKGNTGTTSTSAGYPTTCTVAATCNQPLWTQDALGHQTDYEYYTDSGTNIGAIKTVTAPADVNNVRPQVRYTYGQLQAQVKNSAGNLQSTGQPVWLLSTVSTCRSGTAPGCVGTDNETRTWYANFDNNLLNTGIQTGPGGGTATPTATTHMSFDAAGNALTATDANGNATRVVYNKDREAVGVIGADPDGVGTGNWAKAQRITRDAASGWVTKVEEGTAPSQADSDWANFSSHREVDYQYDGAGRTVRQTLRAGSTNYSETQTSYDGDGRVDCQAIRMNVGAFGSSTGACDQVDPADRIARTEYDAADHVTKTWKGYRSALATNVQFQYAKTGKLQVVLDNNGNRTGYVYDNYDRLYQIFYPDPNVANRGNSSSTDYEQYDHDAADNITARRLRNGSSITYGYDNLNRLTAQNSPHLAQNTDPSTSFGYDLVGHLISAGDESGHTLAFGFDALGNRTSESNLYGSVTSQYDAGGRRTRLTWNDGFYVTYGYDHADHMTGIFENGSTQLVSFGYDDDGRRTSRSFNNGTSKSYSYDAVSRLSSVSLNGSSYPDTITLGSYNPAGQIGTRTQSNDAFAYGGSVNVNRQYVANGLNQYSTIAGAAQSYNLRGDMNGSGGNTYAYNSRDQLISNVSNTTSTFYYDALGRLDTIAPESLHLTYDGAQILTELNYDNTIARRYVYGPGTDEPLIWYEGSGTGTKRYLDADERGSVVRITDAGGAAFANLLYDEYGVPAITNQGRFQYTGQAWIPSLGMYYYKARIYSPTLGRFMQTDPIGYADGPNWYNYARSDPNNSKDSSGKQALVNNLAGFAIGLGVQGITDAAEYAILGTIRTPQEEFGRLVLAGGLGAVTSGISGIDSISTLSTLAKAATRGAIGATAGVANAAGQGKISGQGSSLTGLSLGALGGSTAGLGSFIGSAASSIQFGAATVSSAADGAGVMLVDSAGVAFNVAANSIDALENAISSPVTIQLQIQVSLVGDTAAQTITVQAGGNGNDNTGKCTRNEKGGFICPK